MTFTGIVAVVGMLVALGGGLWWIGRQDRAEERGRDQAHDDLLKGNLETIRKQRDSLANPPSDADVSKAFKEGKF